MAPGPRRAHRTPPPPVRPWRGGCAATLLVMLGAGCVAVSPGKAPGPSPELSACGNGVLEPGEECDGEDLGGATCESASGATDGVLRCTSACRLDTAGCHTCGDGVVEGPEACETDRIGVRSCQELGFEAGSPYCDHRCRLAGCFTCGDGVCASEDGESAYNCPADCGGWRDLALGGHHSCAVTQAGNVYCWGANDLGQRGSATGGGGATPEGLWRVAGVADAARVTTGWAHTCALRDDGRVLCWGSDLAGQLGLGTAGRAGEPVRLAPTEVPGLDDVVDLSAGADHTCALRSDGVVLCWGRNLFGQLGDGTTEDRLSPATVVGLPAARAIASGHTFTCAIALDSGAWCWGMNDVGQLGGGTWQGPSVRDGYGYSARPVPVLGLSAVRQIRPGVAHACAIEERLEGEHPTRELFCWGQGDAGQLGDGSVHPICGGVACSPSPVKVALPFQTQRVDLGARHGCATLADGHVWCWGDPEDGRLGRVVPACPTTGCPPAQVEGPSITGVRHVAVGTAHACAVTADQSLWCWGQNDSGQAGCATATCESPHPLVDRIVR